MKTRHNFNKDLRMDLACSRNDYFRPVFSYIHFKDGYAYACDTHILVKNKLSECSTFTDENGNEKENKYYNLVCAKDITEANRLMQEHMRQGLEDMRLDAIQKTKIIDLI